MVRASKVVAVGAALVLTAGMTAGPSAAAPESVDGAKSYIQKGGPGLLESNKFKKPKSGEMTTFVLDSRTGETYYLGTGAPEEFADEAQDVFEEIGADFTPSVSLRTPSPFGCNGLNFCMRQPVPYTGLYGLMGPGTDNGPWYTIDYVQSGTYKARWYEVGSTAAWTLAPKTATYLAYRQNIRQVQQYS